VSEIPDWMMPHQVQVEAYQGDSGYGDVYRPKMPVRCAVDDRRTLVRSRSGEEVVSETTIRCRLMHETKFRLDSRVTLWPGTTRQRITYVLQTSARDSGGVGEGDHLEVNLK
jgi:hypothetical protein